VRSDALTFMERQGPGQTKRQVHTQQRFGFFAPHLDSWNWNPSAGHV
jgi:hypothetical protein